VILWNQLVFVAVSICLFGISAGAVWVHRSEKQGRLLEGLPAACFGFGATALASTAVYFLTPLSVYSLRHSGLVFLTCFGLFVWVFVFAGVVISSILNEKKDVIGSFYASDLLGASAACVLFVLLVEWTSAENLVFPIAGIGFFNAWLLTPAGQKRKAVFLAASVLTLVFFAGNHSADFFRIRFAKGHRESGAKYVRWNAFSRISLEEGASRLDPHLDKVGTGPLFREKIPEQKLLEIDAFVGMPVTRFDPGRPQGLEFLKRNITSLAYAVKDRPSVYIIGPGGGRDVLAAVANGASEIKAAELNPIIVDIVKNRLGAFSGGIFEPRPGHETVVAEGRSYLARQDGRFDIIAALLVDTWASSLNGSLSLTENHLYTEEAFREYLDRLNDDGILTVSRWIQDPPRQMLRVAVLGYRAVAESRPGSDPRQHLFIAGAEGGGVSGDAGDPRPVLGTCLIKRAPFTPREIEKLERFVRENRFRVYWSPSGLHEPGFAGLNRSPEALQEYIRNDPYDISAPTDDRPFFFMTLKPRNFRAHLGEAAKPDDVKWLFNILVFLALSGGLFALLFGGFVVRHRCWKTPLFFSAIGVGFILIENVLIQIFSVFLGYPTYSLLVVLFGLLFSAGAGSWLSERHERIRRSFRKILLGFAALLALFGWKYAAILQALYFLPPAAKIGVSFAWVSVIGFAMGQAFPHGVRAFAAGKKSFFPWIWAVNGIASVLGSTLAVFISLTAGFSYCLMAGVFLYLLLLPLARGPAAYSG
jgi:hypothetical protein